MKLSLISIYINTFKFQTEPSLHAKKKKEKTAFILDAFVYLLQKLVIYTYYVYTPFKDEDFKLKSKYLFYERTLTRNGASYFSYWTLYQYS